MVGEWIVLVVVAPKDSGAGEVLAAAMIVAVTPLAEEFQKVAAAAWDLDSKD